MRAQFVQVEGLGQVVVGPFLQQHDLVGGGDAGRDDDDGQRAVGGANGPDDPLARDARQHEVGDDQVGTLLAQKEGAFGAREGLAATMALTFQVGGHHFVDGRVILDDQYVQGGIHRAVRASFARCFSGSIIRRASARRHLQTFLTLRQNFL